METKQENHTVKQSLLDCDLMNLPSDAALEVFLVLLAAVGQKKT